jgi:thiamine biosynthesis lipoprotein
MNTSFGLRIDHPNPEQAEMWAGNAVRLLEELEAELSRYRPDSEVSRINRLETNQSMVLSDATDRCLRVALRASELTAGLFDPTLGSHTTKADRRPTDALAGKLVLDPDRPRIACVEPGRQVDLGGIGKGFALDEMSGLLQDLGAESFLLSAGASTHWRIGRRDWSFFLSGSGDRKEIKLRDGEALSSSGVAELGAHVIHPDIGEAPDYHFSRVWVISSSAAFADAFSTACLLMSAEELQAFSEAVDEVIALYALPREGAELIEFKGSVSI